MTSLLVVDKAKTTSHSHCLVYSSHRTECLTVINLFCLYNHPICHSGPVASLRQKKMSREIGSSEKLNTCASYESPATIVKIKAIYFGVSISSFDDSRLNLPLSGRNARPSSSATPTPLNCWLLWIVFSYLCFSAEPEAILCVKVLLSVVCVYLCTYVCVLGWSVGAGL